MKKIKVVCETPLYKVVLVREGMIEVENRCIQSPEEAAKIVRKHLQGVDREHFIGLYLNSANYLIGIHTISIGILNSSLVHPREVFKLAYMMNAATIIVSHNHPSGNVEPSSDDITLTKQLVDAGKILGIPLNDHIIVTEYNGYTSFAEKGLL
ncbi:MAG: DNA repair protein RadC [Ignavibacteriales bacterium]|nr:DNA repair protein RadC [Ignavibacteriales bacterium]